MLSADPATVEGPRYVLRRNPLRAEEIAASRQDKLQRITQEVAQQNVCLAQESKPDGCYCLKTDLGPRQASKETVHDRYKDLAHVEWAFRTCKTIHLETWPVYVRQASRTRGHALVVMLAYLLVAELARCWEHLDVTVPEGIAALSMLCTTEVSLGDRARFQRIPEPCPPVQQLLTAAEVHLPAALPHRDVRATTKRKLPARRKTR